MSCRVFIRFARSAASTGDGEIDPGNMVEVLFLNNEDGQENYDAMDAKVQGQLTHTLGSFL